MFSHFKVSSCQFSLQCLCLSTPPDIQAALYELCWQVVLGNLKLDLVASVLGDMMVRKIFKCFEPHSTHNVCAVYLQRDKPFIARLLLITIMHLIDDFQPKYRYLFFFQELRDDMPSILADVFSILGKSEVLF